MRKQAEPVSLPFPPHRHMGPPLYALLRMILGGAGYGALEVLWRGYTHISMVAAGGLCFLFLAWLANTRLPWPVRCALGGGAITLVELAAGCVVNLALGLEVWDYTAEPFQFLGQICLRFTLLWCLLSGLVMLLYRVIRNSLKAFPALPGRAAPIHRRQPQH